MENSEKELVSSNSTSTTGAAKKKPSGIGGIFTAAVVAYYMGASQRSSIEGLLVYAGAIGAGFLFYWVHRRLRNIKNYIFRDLAALFIAALFSSIAINLILFLLTFLDS